LGDSKEIQRLKNLLLPIFKKSKTKKAVLFGSFAKGTQSRKSDVDLMIITETDKRFFDRYEDYEEIQRVLADRSVDMLIYTSDELERIAHRIFIKGIIETGEVIYEC
jgi:predicted nucleotidyltransferase